MSAEIVNLRRVRKAKVRAEKEKTASENRLSFGRGAAARRHDAATKALDKAKLDGLRRERPDTKDES